MKIYLIGIGMGDRALLTGRASELIINANYIIGARRITDIVPRNKNIFVSYDTEEILDFIKSISADNVCILLSGDVGFYSGAKRLLSVLRDYDTELVPGISSVVYFCSRLKIDWQDIKLLSLHGKEQNIIMYIKRYKRVFALLGGGEGIKQLCQKLCMYGMGDVTLHIGERLSYPDERITSIKACDIKERDFNPLSVVIAENNNAKHIPGSIDDEDFIRADVPMTKKEIRQLSISMLELERDSVLYDVGAGTGSVCVEACERVIDGRVYAIEKDEAALELIKKNKIKFAADNVEIIRGTAPEAFDDLPKPTHIFIGGSSGNLYDIVGSAFDKNPNVKIVINAISLNTVSEALNIINKHNYDSDIICANISRSKNISSYKLMYANNPVYIISLKQRNK